MVQNFTSDILTVFNQQRGKGHANNPDGNQQRGQLFIQQLIFACQCNQNKTELPHLRQSNPDAQCGRQLFLHNQCGKSDGQYLNEHDPQHHQQQDGQVIAYNIKIQQSANRDKKHRHQNIFKRENLGRQLMAIMAFSQHHPGKKSPQRHGQTKQLRKPSSEQSDKKRRQNKNFIKTQAPNFIEKAGQQPAPYRQQKRHSKRPFQKCNQQGGYDPLFQFRHRNNRNNNQKRNDDKILKQQNGNCQFSCLGVQSLLVRQNFDDNRRRGHGQDAGHNE
eukprot:TRINITY_DN9481_c0_g1_i1.p2 TRINITY_DN9481_c0_g1~~TRINITY_DN9481_c0_g1_i1.p2  ORF type:complete len:275 (-),score=-11.66 TRINITY_DN9481_c0_g1_i1:626-1450(-)